MNDFENGRHESENGNDDLFSRIRKVSIVDAGASVITIYLAIKGTVATVLGWEYADVIAQHAIDFHEYNELVYSLTAGVGTILSSASFWALMTMFGVRAVVERTLKRCPQESDK